MYSKNIQKLIDLFSKFPTVGKRIASRFVFYLIKLSPAEFEELIDSMKKLREKTKFCSFCFNPYEMEANENLCPICSNPLRDKTTLCLVEKEADLISIEKTKKYQGLYFILGETISFLKSDENKTKIKELEERIRNPKNFGLDAASSGIKEVIIATNLTYEGETGGLYLERKLKALSLPYPLKITRLAKGLSTGSEIEYADEETLTSAFEGRK
jgi:recombination protein RecR